MAAATPVPAVEARELTIGYGSRIIMQNLNFAVFPGSVTCIMGGSGCGKSTLLKHLIGLYEPFSGDILLGGQSLVQAEREEKRRLMRTFGVTYQGGALFGSLTLAENVEVPLLEYTDLDAAARREVIMEKLRLVNLEKFSEFYPAEISGGMKKRAGLARALALNPKLLFFDEPSAGLDPVSSANLDRFILRMREELGVTVVVITHELDSVFAIADNCLMLDRETKTLAASGSPAELLASPVAWVREFMSRSGLRRQ